MNYTCRQLSKLSLGTLSTLAFRASTAPDDLLLFDFALFLLLECFPELDGIVIFLPVTCDSKMRKVYLCRLEARCTLSTLAKLTASASCVCFMIERLRCSRSSGVFRCFAFEICSAPIHARLED